WLRLPVPLRPRLRVPEGRSIGDVLAWTDETASWGAADANIRRPCWQRDCLIALADGRLDALDVASDARRIAGGDIYELDRMLAAFGGAPLRLHLVEPRGLGILGEKRTMHAGEHRHGVVLARRRGDAGEGLREGARDIEDGEKATHSNDLTTM